MSRLSFLRRSSCLVGLVALLSGCGGGTKDENALASLDSRLVNAAATSNAGGAEAANAAVPDKAEPRPQAVATRHPAERPAPRRVAALNSLSSAADAPVNGCGHQVHADPAYARRLPAAFALYPGAQLTEAAAVSSGRCGLTVVSFTTPESPASVIRHYRAAVTGAGFDAELRACRTEQRLGGTRGEDAYILFVRRTATGGSAVDMVVRAEG